MKFISPSNEVSKLGFFSETRPTFGTMAELLKACKNCQAGFDSRDASVPTRFYSTAIAGYYGGYLYLTKLRYFGISLDMRTDKDTLRSLFASVTGGGSNRDPNLVSGDLTATANPFTIGAAFAPAMVLPIPDYILEYTTSANSAWTLPAASVLVNQATGVSYSGGLNIVQRAGQYKQVSSSVGTGILSYNAGGAATTYPVSLKGVTYNYDFSIVGVSLQRTSQDTRSNPPAYTDNTTPKTPRVPVTYLGNTNHYLDYYFIPINRDDANLDILLLSRNVDFNTLANVYEPRTGATGTMQPITPFAPVNMTL